MIFWLSCVCQSCSRISQMFVFVLWLLVTHDWHKNNTFEFLMNAQYENNVEAGRVFFLLSTYLGRSMRLCSKGISVLKYLFFFFKRYLSFCVMEIGKLITSVVVLSPAQMPDAQPTETPVIELKTFNKQNCDQKCHHNQLPLPWHDHI